MYASIRSTNSPLAAVGTGASSASAGHAPTSAWYNSHSSFLSGAISPPIQPRAESLMADQRLRKLRHSPANSEMTRSEEHTSELQSRLHLVCRLLLEKKKAPTDHSSPGSNTSTTATCP